MAIVIPAVRLPWWLRRHTPAPDERPLDRRGRYWVRVFRHEDRFWHFRLTERGHRIGYAYLSQTEPGVFSLDDLLVEKPHRGRGLGPQLLQGIVCLARTEGGRLLIGRIAPVDIEENPRLPEWYKRHGFTIGPPRDEKDVASIERAL